MPGDTSKNGANGSNTPDPKDAASSAQPSDNQPTLTLGTDAPIDFEEELGVTASPTQPKTYLEGRGTWMMTGALIAICSLALLTLLLWVIQMPSIESVAVLSSTSLSIEDAKKILGATATPEAIDSLRNAWAERPDTAKTLEMLTAIRKQHTDGYKDLFQLLVLSGLVPIFTLLAGYVFGKNQRLET